MQIISASKIRSMKFQGNWVIWMNFPEQDMFFDGFKTTLDAINFVVDFIETKSKLWPDREGYYTVQTY